MRVSWPRPWTTLARTDSNPSRPKESTRFGNRARDSRLVIDHLLGDPAIGPRIDASRTAAAGFSLGGSTAILPAGGMPDFEGFRRFCASPQRGEICAPQREYPVDFAQQPPLLAKPHAVLLAAGPGNRNATSASAAWGCWRRLWAGARPWQLIDIRVPVLVIAGNADRVIAMATNASLLVRVIPGRARGW